MNRGGPFDLEGVTEKAEKRKKVARRTLTELFSSTGCRAPPHLLLSPLSDPHSDELLFPFSACDYIHSRVPADIPFRGSSAFPRILIASTVYGIFVHYRDHGMAGSVSMDNHALLCSGYICDRVWRYP